MSEPERKFYWGKYRGICKDNVDPEKLGRIKAIVPELLGRNSLTDWAYPSIPYGGLSDIGMSFIPEVEAGVWIEFEAGDINRPIWSGCWISKPSNASELPKLSRGIPDESNDKPRGFDEAETFSGKTIIEPPSGFGSEYPYNKVIKTKSGHIFELDDTPGQERINIFHRLGSYIELKRDGTVLIKANGKLSFITDKDKIEHVNSNEIKVVEGSSEENCNGEKIIFVGGNLQEVVQGAITREYQGEEVVLYKGKKNITYQGEHSIKVGASLTQNIGGSKIVNIGGADNKMVLGTQLTQVGNTLASSIAKKIDVLLGDYVLSLTAGNIKVNNVLGNYEVSMTAGSVTLKNAIGEIEINATGQLTFKNALGEIKMGTAGVVDITGIQVNAGGALPLALFSELLTMVTTYNSHTHLYSPGPGTPAPTAVPLPLVVPLPVGTTILKGS